VSVAALAFLWVRIHHWETQTQQYDLQQRSLFTEVFPQRTIPVAVRPHLESELKRRQGLSGQQAMPTIGVTLDTVTRVLTALPGDLRFRIQSIRADDKTIDLDGQARSHTDAEQIANAVRAAGIELDPLRSENLAQQGVTFSLHGVPAVPRLAEKRR
jgi:type II secretory pathway component PulL